MAGDGKPRADVIAEIDEFLDPAVENVGELALGRIDHHPFGAQRQKCALAFAGDIDRRRVDEVTRVEPDRARSIARHILHRAVQTIVLAYELGDEGILRPFVEFGRRRKLLHDTVLEYSNTVGHGESLTLVVRDIDHGNRQLFMQVLDLILHLLAQLLVEGAQGFIHEDEIGVENKCARHRDPLLLTSRQLGWPAVTERRQLNHVENPLHPFLDLRLAHAADLAGEMPGSRIRSCAGRARSSGTPCRCRACAAAPC